ncbi:UDP glycosyltransferase 9-like [Salvia splendens]|uniref:UDP glycosyltransferase 9-like n=1 Tax=Salvia splendens TaxID=180675 RepID=UPI001C26D926|nr:UDP glycosyltransferase 9-like [Salvia splendens]
MGIEVGSGRKAQVIVIPYPAQGHINPALAFAKCLASKGLLVAVVTTTSIAKSANFSDCASLTLHTVSDGSEHVEGTETVKAYLKRFRCNFSRNLADFMDNHMSCARAIIYDSIMPWVLDIAKDRGLAGACFFTQSCGVSAVFHHLGQGLQLRYPYEDDVAVSLPALPPLEKRDLPSFCHLVDPDQCAVKLLNDQFSNLDRADWVFFNTFDNLETRILEWMRRRWAITTIGPTFLLLGEAKKHSISMFEPKADAYREWLESRETHSVIYVSFGSIASLEKEQMAELGHALLNTGRHFLWVVRSSELDKLPPDFANTAAGKGLVVEWCHQPEVLAHKAVACFVTHCGWNSTLEGLSHGVPLVAMAQWVDQNTNAKLVADVWGAGARCGGGDGIVGREEIAMCIERVVGGDVRIRRNALRWKELAAEAVGKGGSSDVSVLDFVSKIVFDDGMDFSPTSVLV